MSRLETAPRHAGTMRVVRSRGALSGFLLLVLGLWGALIPFVGPYFHYAYTPDATWTWTAGRLWLELLPGLAAAVAGLLLIGTANRSVGVLAGWLAAAAGAWFVVGPVLGRLWNGTEGAAGLPVGGTARQVWEQIGFFSGLGAAILFLGALALGRFTVTSVRDLRAAERARTPEPEAAPATTAPATAVRDTRAQETRVQETRVQDTRAGDTRAQETRAQETRVMTEPVGAGTARPGTSAGAHSEEARDQGLVGRFRSGSRGDRSTEGGGATRDDALDRPRE